MGNLNPNLLTKDTQAVMDDAADILKAYGKSMLTPEAVLLALIRSKGTAAANVLQYFAERRGADLDRLERQVKLAVQSPPRYGRRPEIYRVRQTGALISAARW